MGLILDSSVLIAAERGRLDVDALLEAEAAMEPLFISSITASELLHGVHRAPPQLRPAREAFVEAIIRTTPILSFDLACARRHAELWSSLESVGERIGAHDMMIAAICLRFDHRLAMLNEGAFGRVDGLRLVATQKYRKA